VNSDQPPLKELATRFLTSLPPEERTEKQGEVYKFTRYCGSEKSLSDLRGPTVAGYAERLSPSDTDYEKKLEIIRGFLIHSKKQGWCQTNLAVHIKVRKPRARRKSAVPATVTPPPEAVTLTEESYTEMEAELKNLKARSTQLIEDIRKAAADKDFRENAPLAAAREQRGHVEGQIKELESILKSAVIIDREQKSRLVVNPGDRVTLKALDSGEELKYYLVSPREVDPTQGKISTVSPMGKAIVGQPQGAVIEVAAPAGKMKYRIESIEH
jgi:transcription elongation factor GreA